MGCRTRAAPHASPRPLVLAVLAAALATHAAAQVSPPYYNDQKQNCSRVQPSSFCYGPGPKTQGVQIKSCTVPGTIALTFDDGPHPTNTPFILSVLERYGWKATFFQIGRFVARRPDITQALLDAGHQVGTHTWSHKRLAGLAPEQVDAELAGFEAAWLAANFTGPSAGLVPAYVRFPGGEIDAASAAAAQEWGYVPVHWGYLNLDQKGALAEDMVDIHASHFGPGVAAENLTLIVQMHDKSDETAASFPDVAAYLNATLGAAGVRFVTVAECLGGDVAPYRTPGKATGAAAAPAVADLLAGVRAAAAAPPPIPRANATPSAAAVAALRSSTSAVPKPIAAASAPTARRPLALPPPPPPPAGGIAFSLIGR